MTKTMADHARAYRQRKAKKLERLAVYEAALREIAEANEARPIPGSQARDIARQALDTPHAGERDE